MTHVTQLFSSAPLAFSNLAFYTIEIITFNGESIIVEVEASSPEEAQEIAVALHDDVDYTMVQGCW